MSEESKCVVPLESTSSAPTLVILPDLDPYYTVLPTKPYSLGSPFI